jgi:hypothetical protein
MTLMQGPEKGPCECGLADCTQYGALGRPRRDGTRHVRGCACRSCRGKANRSKGTRKQRAARRALGIAGPSLGADHEENWRGAVRVEVKAGAQVRPAATAFRKMRDQSEGSRPIGDNRPFAGIAMPDGESDGIFMCRLSDLAEVATAVVESL